MSDARKMEQISFGVSIERLLINCSSANSDLSNKLTLYEGQTENHINHTTDKKIEC